MGRNAVMLREARGAVWIAVGDSYELQVRVPGKRPGVEVGNVTTADKGDTRPLHAWFLTSDRLAWLLPFGCWIMAREMPRPGSESGGASMIRTRDEAARNCSLYKLPPTRGPRTA